MPGGGPESANTVEQQANSLKSKINTGTLTKEELDTLAKELDKPEVLTAMKSIIQEDFAKATVNSLNQKDPLSESDQSILRLFAILYPTGTLDTRLTSTNKVSGKVSVLLLKGGDALNFEELKKLSPEKLQDLFKTLNKGDLQALAKSMPDKAPEGMSEANLILLKQLLSSTVNAMIANGMSIETPEDVVFLEKNGNEAVKKMIAESKTGEGILKDYTGKSKLIIKMNEKGALEIRPLIDTTNKKIVAGIDISKINTVDMKKSAEEIKKGLPDGFDKAKVQEMVQNLLDSKNPALRGMGELFKILGALFGLSFEKKTDPEKGNETLTKKQRYELIKDMIRTDTGKRYDIDSLFEKGALKTHADTKMLQTYLGDLSKIGLGGGLPEYDKEKKVFVANDKLTTAIKGYQKSLGIPETGVLNKAGLTATLARYDANGDLLPVARPEGGTPDKQETPPPVTKDAPPPLTESPKDLLMKTLEGKTYAEIRRDPLLTKAIQETLGVTPANGKYGPKTINAVKIWQSEIGAKPDGMLGKDTIQKYQDKKQQKPVLGTKI